MNRGYKGNHQAPGVAIHLSSTIMWCSNAFARGARSREAAVTIQYNIVLSLILFGTSKSGAITNRSPMTMKMLLMLMTRDISTYKPSQQLNSLLHLQPTSCRSSLASHTTVFYCPAKVAAWCQCQHAPNPNNAVVNHSTKHKPIWANEDKESVHCPIHYTLFDTT